MTTPPAPQRGLRLGRHTVRAWLERLDQRGQPPGRANVRCSARFEYRPESLSLEVTQVDGSSASYAVACRNLSRQGLGLLAGQFIYPRSRCKLELVSPHGRRHIAAGRVARCRYLLGSGSLHEVGLTFDRPLDLEVFAPHARLVRMLLVDEDTRTQELVAGLIGNLHVDVRCVPTPQAAVAAIAEENSDLILLDLEGPTFDALAFTRQLRDLGYVGPIVGMAVHTGQELRSSCAAAGCTGYIPKPITRADLHELIASLMGPPLLSSLAQDGGLTPLIDRYVSALREKASAMALASEVGDFDTLASLARQLRAEAGSYGFETITKEAAYVHALIITHATPARIRKALNNLLHLCLKARPASSPPEMTPAYTEPGQTWPRVLPRFPGETDQPDEASDEGP